MSSVKSSLAVSVDNSNQSLNQKTIHVPIVFTPSEVGLVGVPLDKLPKSVKVAEQKIEEKSFKHFGLTDYRQIKARLQTEKNPFDAVRTYAADGGDLMAYLNPKTGKYVVNLQIEKDLYRALSNKAREIKNEIRAEKETKLKSEIPNPANPNQTIAGRSGIDQTNLQRLKFDKLLRDAQILPTSFGLPTNLTNLNHIVVTLPQSASPNADSALSAYIEKRFGGGNLFGENKLNILNSAKQNGVKVENLKVSPNNNRVIEFDLSIESLLKLQKSYLDVQAKVNTDIAIADKIKHEMALNQFLLGVMQGAWDDVKGTYNTVTSPLQTIQQIREAIGILSQLSTEDLKAITAELSSKAINATPGEAAHAAGYVVGTAAVELLLGKGTGVALSALSKTKAGAEFLARIGKLADKTGELASLGKLKIAETFSDQAAAIAKQKLVQSGVMRGLLPGAIPPELVIIAGNKIKNGAVKFADFSRQMINEFGEQIRPHLDKLYRDNLISLNLNKGEEILSSSGKIIDEFTIREAKEKVFDFVKNNKSVELEEFFEGKNGIRNKFGSDFVNELKKSRDEFVDGLYETTRRTVDTHDLLGGHIRDKHIGRSESWLRDRLKSDRSLEDVDYASSFTNEATANRALGKFAKQYNAEIEAYLKNPNKETLEMVFNFGESAGKGVTRDKSGQWEANRVYVMIVKDNSDKGWHVLTAYPTLRKEVIK